VRGQLLQNEALAPYTWFRVGGPADALFIPADLQDLQDFMAALPADVPVTTIGVGSNLIVRDGGVRGVVVRLAGRAFGGVEALEGARISAGAGALDSIVARTAARAGVAGLEFYDGVPGTIGGAVTMNAGCYGRETRDVLVEVLSVDRTGALLSDAITPDLSAYRRGPLPPERIVVQVVFQGRPGDPADIEARMAEITRQRELSQPIRDKTGGSTFKNPPGESAWKLVDRAGFRGARRGGAQVSEKHCNFLINTGAASAGDIEALGEEVRAGVKAAFDVQLEWEIKRIGER
jgi:UDP-N-acetylmuramate dehydrogenase